MMGRYAYVRIAHRVNLKGSIWSPTVETTPGLVRCFEMNRSAINQSGPQLCTFAVHTVPITSRLLTNGATLGSGVSFIATFVVNQDGTLMLADRSSEHVACAGGAPVCSAGEMTFLLDDTNIGVVLRTNEW